MNLASGVECGTAGPGSAERIAARHGANNFDYIRLFAATQVMIFHALYHLGIESPAWSAVFAPFSGVPIFFTVSGFLITASYERSSSLRSYAEKRARRIFPGLWLCIALTSVVLLILGYPLLSPQGVVWFAGQLVGIVYTPDFLRSFGFGSYNGSLWTIPVELQFYATVPLLAVLVRRARNRTALLLAVLAGATAVSLAIRFYVPGLDSMFEGSGTLGAKLIKYSFVPHYFQFVLGATAFYLSLHVRPWLRGKALAWLALFLTFGWLAPYSTWTVVVSQIMLGLLTISAAFTPIGSNWLRGYDISYGVYLFHGLIVNIFIVAGLVHSPGYIYALMLCSYAAGWLSWVLVESRCLRRDRGRETAATAQPDSVAGLNLR